MYIFLNGVVNAQILKKKKIGRVIYIFNTIEFPFFISCKIEVDNKIVLDESFRTFSFLSKQTIVINSETWNYNERPK